MSAVFGECNVKRLINLKHVNLSNFLLKLDGSSWVTDSFLINLSNLKQISFLNVDHTNISSHSSQPIQQFRKLKALCIGGTRINAETVE